MSGNWHKRGNIRGADGVGVPTGGQPGQALQKVGNSDFATAWANLDYADLVGKVPKSALPDIGNSTTPVASEAAMLNLPAVVGNMAIRTDIGKTFVLAEEPANVLEDWVELVTTADVQSVNGKTGNGTLTKADGGRGGAGPDLRRPVGERQDGQRHADEGGRGAEECVEHRGLGQAGGDPVRQWPPVCGGQEEAGQCYLECDGVARGDA